LKRKRAIMTLKKKEEEQNAVEEKAAAAKKAAEEKEQQEYSDNLRLQYELEKMKQPGSVYSVEAKMAIAKIEAIVPERLLARLWKTIDSNADGCVSKMEAEVSVVGSLQEYWKAIDADANGAVSAEEWSAFFGKLAASEGEAMYRKAVATMIYENDISIDDLYAKRIERVVDLKRKRAIMTLKKKEIVDILWGVMDSSGDGSLRKQEIQFSPLGEVLLSHWSELDSQPDGRVTPAEFEAYLDKVKAKHEGKYKAWLVDLIYEAGAAGGALEILTRRMAETEVKKKMVLAEIAVVEPKLMLARMWKTIDVDGDGDLRKSEIEMSVFGEMLADHWHELDANPDGRVTLGEWNAYWEKKAEELGEGTTRNLLAEMLYEADVDVQDIVTGTLQTTADLRMKHAVSQLETSDVVGRIFDVVDVNGSGNLSKKEIQMSVVGELLMGYWEKMDGNSDGSVDRAEFGRFFAKVKSAQPPGTYSRWLANVVWNAGVNVDDLITEDINRKALALKKKEEEQKAAEEKARKLAAEAAERKKAALQDAAILAVGPTPKDTVKSGFLRIQEGRFFPTWNPGWFVLTSHDLTLYPVKGEAVSSEPSGTISMSEMLGCCSDGLDNGTPNTFKLSVLDAGHPVVWPLRAIDDGEEREWKMAFLQVQFAQEEVATPRSKERKQKATESAKPKRAC